MKIKPELLLVIIMLIAISCEKEEPSADVVSDKQVRFDFQFRSSVWNTDNSTTGVILPNNIMLLRFNLANYENIDSVIFTALIWSSQIDNNCYAALYNVTDDQVISGSQIESTMTDAQGEYVFSKDLKEVFPNKEITLGIKLKSQYEGVNVFIYPANIFIYKH
jgi:hypothetical protein